jgi:hypothetical protein
MKVFLVPSQLIPSFSVSSLPLLTSLHFTALIFRIASFANLDWASSFPF